MKAIYKDWLYTKYLLVSEDKNRIENLELKEQVIVFTKLMRGYGIKVIDGVDLLDRYILTDVSRMLDVYNYVPFYVNFPESVKLMTKEQKLVDQLINYLMTYGLDDFSSPARHSLLEPNVERILKTKDKTIKEFKVVKEEDAYRLLEESVLGLIASSRPLNNQQLAVVATWLMDFGANKQIKFKSKDLIIKLAIATGDAEMFSEYLSLNDILKMATIGSNYLIYYIPDEHDEKSFKIFDESVIKHTLNDLRIRNRQRSTITKMLDVMLSKREIKSNSFQLELEDVLTRRKYWKAILHQLHYKAKCEAGKVFLEYVYSEAKDKRSFIYNLDKNLSQGNIKEAIDIALKYKGISFALRNLKYFLSNANDEEDINSIISLIDKCDNKTILFQLYNYIGKLIHGKFNFPRYFIFYSVGVLKTFVNEENENDILSFANIFKYGARILDAITNQLKALFKDKIGKVYLDKDLEQIALPIKANTGSSGLGVLPTGSRIPIKTSGIRAFTYWEKVNDIDLSAFGFDKKGEITEYSWRNMYDEESQYIVFSGDITNGYNGGSEYFDISLEEYKKENPDMRYLVFIDNVYSYETFSKVYCKAGFMPRNELDKGKVYEPKTVASSFIINANAIEAYLFAIDLETNELVWLNIASGSRNRAAGDSEIAALYNYLEVGKRVNYKMLFSLLATEFVTKPKDADVLVTDKDKLNKNNLPIYHSYDIEKIIKLINS